MRLGFFILFIHIALLSDAGPPAGEGQPPPQQSRVRSGPNIPPAPVPVPSASNVRLPKSRSTAEDLNAEGQQPSQTTIKKSTSHAGNLVGMSVTNTIPLNLVRGEVDKVGKSGHIIDPVSGFYHMDVGTLVYILNIDIPRIAQNKPVECMHSKGLLDVYLRKATPGEAFKDPLKRDELGNEMSDSMSAIRGPERILDRDYTLFRIVDPIEIPGQAGASSAAGPSMQTVASPLETSIYKGMNTTNVFLIVLLVLTTSILYFGCQRDRKLDEFHKVLVAYETEV